MKKEIQGEEHQLVEEEETKMKGGKRSQVGQTVSFSE